MNDTFLTRDLGEVAMLLSKGFILMDTQWKDNVAYFVFNRSEEARKLTHAYNFEGGVQVDAKKFYESMILVKRKILAKYAPERFKKDVRNYEYTNR